MAGSPINSQATVDLFVGLLVKMMKAIEKKYIFDDKNRKIAVQIDIQTFEKIEEVLEDYALGQLIRKNETSEVLELMASESFYNTLDKAK